MALGVYISVPFCRTKCSYCNFASDVFSKSAYENYVARVVDDIANSRQLATKMECEVDDSVDSIYLGGGTPSLLDGPQLSRIFAAVRSEFKVTPDAEVTVESAPGTLTPAVLEKYLQCGVNRVSLGVQSFIDQEAQSVGRMHKRATVLEDIAHLRDAGISNISVDLIAGLPHQSAESWEFSVSETIAIGVPHASVYMLEVDEDSRLGRELIAGGSRYHAHFVPDENATADSYQRACEMFASAGIAQYEISNFARNAARNADRPATNESRHNLKYWTRQPYLGVGVDAHSMLRGIESQDDFKTGSKIGSNNKDGLSVRFATPDSLDAFMNRGPLTRTPITPGMAIEEEFFLGLRLNRGIDLADEKFKGRQGFECQNLDSPWESAIQQCVSDGLLERQGTVIRLTARGRLLSNEVFARFLVDETEETEEIKVGTGNVNPR